MMYSRTITPNKTFTHKKLIEPVSLPRETTEHGRLYTTPAGVFPSVTTILDSVPAKALEIWKAKVGEVEANRIKTVIANRGTRFHKIIETYLKNETIEKADYMPDTLLMFREMMPYLDEIDEVYGLEMPVYSTKHKYAGTLDIWAMRKGHIAICDNKNYISDLRYAEEKISKYFAQLGAYATAVEEMGGPKTNWGVLFFGSPEFGAYVKEKNIDEDKEHFLEIRERYATFHGR